MFVKLIAINNSLENLNYYLNEEFLGSENISVYIKSMRIGLCCLENALLQLYMDRMKCDSRDDSCEIDVCKMATATILSFSFKLGVFFKISQNKSDYNTALKFHQICQELVACILSLQTSDKNNMVLTYSGNDIKCIFQEYSKTISELMVQAIDNWNLDKNGLLYKMFGSIFKELPLLC